MKLPKKQIWIDEETYRRLKSDAALCGKTLQEYVKERSKKKQNEIKYFP
jgi:predicted DNA-binding protein